MQTNYTVKIFIFWDINKIFPPLRKASTTYVPENKKRENFHTLIIWDCQYINNT